MLRPEFDGFAHLDVIDAGLVRRNECDCARFVGIGNIENRVQTMGLHVASQGGHQIGIITFLFKFEIVRQGDT